MSLLLNLRNEYRASASGVYEHCHLYHFQGGPQSPHRTTRPSACLSLYDYVRNCTKLLVPVGSPPPGPKTAFEASTSLVGHGQGWVDRFVLLSNHNIEGESVGSVFVKLVHSHPQTHAVSSSGTADMTWRCRVLAALLMVPRTDTR
jgi:hypothetical protein